MYTLTVIIWLLSIGYFFYSFYRHWGYRSDWAGLAFLIYLLGFIPVSEAISFGLSYDMYGSFGIEIGITAFFIWGLIQLALVMLASLVSPIFSKNINSYNSTYSNTSSYEATLNLVFQIIGLIGSVLGIISFYLDYLR